MIHPWEDVADTLRQRYPSIPGSWLERNFRSDDWVRENIYRYFAKSVESPNAEVRDFFLDARATMYAYWQAFTLGVSDCIFWDESEAFQFQGEFLESDPGDYCRLCGITRCFHIVLSEREHDNTRNGVINAISYCFDLFDNQRHEWIELGNKKMTQDDFSQAAMECINTQCNQMLALENLDLTRPENVDSRDRLKWEGLAIILLDVHKKMMKRPHLIEWTAEAMKRA